ncbi:hypothetical protein ARMSODRAFT_983920 [Armillaria solidipes]|uniref:Uncharacterized protein n=1 Tax=Armillaria solidipes TaxID=1076256 RepID=A0A2H3AHD2_9AGAR|nr:hypothetical protein ARMSODRAFT_983920 [Armillaria solidipes]
MLILPQTIEAECSELFADERSLLSWLLETPLVTRTFFAWNTAIYPSKASADHVLTTTQTLYLELSLQPIDFSLIASCCHLDIPTVIHVANPRRNNRQRNNVKAGGITQHALVRLVPDNCSLDSVVQGFDRRAGFEGSQQRMPERYLGGAGSGISIIAMRIILEFIAVDVLVDEMVSV